MNDHDRDMLDRLLDQYDTDTSNISLYEIAVWKSKRRKLWKELSEAAGSDSKEAIVQYLKDNVGF